MAKLRPTRAWGAILLQLRERAGLSGAKVVQQLGMLGIKLDRRTLYTYEAGRVTAPDAAVVWGLAHLYGAHVEDLLTDLVAARNNVSPKRRGEDEPTERSLTLTVDEIGLVKLVRRLPPDLKAQCQEFVRFQLERTRTRRRPSSAKIG